MKLKLFSNKHILWLFIVGIFLPNITYATNCYHYSLYQEYSDVPECDPGIFNESVFEDECGEDVEDSSSYQSTYTEVTEDDQGTITEQTVPCTVKVYSKDVFTVIPPDCYCYLDMNGELDSLRPRIPWPSDIPSDAIQRFIEKETDDEYTQLNERAVDAPVGGPEVCDLSGTSAGSDGLINVKVSYFWVEETDEGPVPHSSSSNFTDIQLHWKCVPY